MTNPIVVDLSHWQSNVDFAKLKAGGTVGVILKATEGATGIDATFRDRYDTALAIGLAVSSYHYLRPGDAMEQMKHYINTVKPRQGERICLDHEDDGVSLNFLNACVSAIMQIWPDLQITIYSGHLIKNQLGTKRNEILAQYTSLWLAQYTSGQPSWPTATWPTWSLWQYSQEEKASGVSGFVDGNKWNGDQDALLRWFGPIEQPKPQPVVKTVSIDIKADDGVAVQIKVNGQLITT